MPDLSSVVGPISNIGVPQISNILCHQATLYWLLQAKFGRNPTLDEIAEAGPIIRTLVTKYGRKLSKTDYDTGPIFRPGTIFFFQGNSDHSCIVNRQKKICGYNQVGWFDAGKSCLYTEHDKSDVVWLANNMTVKGSHGHPCAFYGANDISAEGNLQYCLEHH